MPVSAVLDRLLVLVLWVGASGFRLDLFWLLAFELECPRKLARLALQLLIVMVSFPRVEKFVHVLDHAVQGRLGR